MVDHVNHGVVLKTTYDGHVLYLLIFSIQLQIGLIMEIHPRVIPGLNPKDDGLCRNSGLHA